MTVTLEPDTVVPSSDIGAGQSVYLKVQDERSEDTVGNRGSAMMKGAQITLEQDLSAVVQSALTDMLRTKGFDVRYDGTDGQHPALRVEIRGLSYETSTGFWTGGVQVTAAIKAIARGETGSYENFYRYDNEDRVVVVPGADSNNARINAALNDVLHQLMRDNKLLEVLAEK
ncbi:MAG: YajG family lipoprotein [Woeseiaceae bacterium]